MGLFLVSFDGRRSHWVGHQAGKGGSCCRQGKPAAPHALLYQVLLLCQEGGLKLALNGQGVGATSLGQQVLEQLRELRISGSVQLYCVHY